MVRHDKTGRGQTFSFKLLLHLRFCGRGSAAILAAFLQLPAFLSSCNIIEEQDSPARKVTIRTVTHINKGAEAIDVFFFDNDGTGRLDSYQQISLADSLSLYALSGTDASLMVVLSAREGDTDRWMGVSTYSDLCKYSFRLEDEDPSRPLLAGETTLENGISRRADIPLKPKLSSITIRSLLCDFSGRPYAGSSFTNTRLFLSYAGAECLPLGSQDNIPISFLNPGLVDSLSVLALPHPEMLLQDGCGDVGARRIEVGRTFYCYPHPDTKLVLEGTVDGITCYYPIPVGTLLGSGQSLEMDISLLRIGSPDPDIPTESGAVMIDFITKPWEYRPDTIVKF